MQTGPPVQAGGASGAGPGTVRELGVTKPDTASGPCIGGGETRCSINT